MDNKTIVLKHVSVIFSELEDNGYGRNIVINANDPEVQKQITEWVKANNINGGVAKFKDFTNKDGVTTKQYTFKLSQYTDIKSSDESAKNYGLGYGAVINMQARAFEYDNKFGKGISSSIDAIFVVVPTKNNTMANLAE